jgi:hypothetical protein
MTTQETQRRVPARGSGIHKVLMLFRAKLWQEVTTRDFVMMHQAGGEAWNLGPSYRQRITDLRETYGITVQCVDYTPEGSSERHSAYHIPWDHLAAAQRLLRRIEGEEQQDGGASQG